MELLDYVIKTGEKQGNSKHFQNFLKIHSHMMKQELKIDNLMDEKINGF